MRRGISATRPRSNPAITASQITERCDELVDVAGGAATAVVTVTGLCAGLCAEPGFALCGDFEGLCATATLCLTGGLTSFKAAGCCLTQSLYDAPCRISQALSWARFEKMPSPQTSEPWNPGALGCGVAFGWFTTP